MNGLLRKQIITSAVGSILQSTCGCFQVLKREQCFLIFTVPAPIHSVQPDIICNKVAVIS